MLNAKLNPLSLEDTLREMRLRFLVLNLSLEFNIVQVQFTFLQIWFEVPSQNFSFCLTAHFLEVELQPDSVIVSDRGSSLVLSCQASGCPHPEFFWKHPSNMSILGRIKTDGFQSQLFLDPVEVEDEGTYLCEVTCGSIKKSKQTEVKVFCKYLKRFTI